MNKVEQLIAELCPEGVEFKELGDVGEFYGGLTGKSKNDFTDGNAKFISYMNVFNNLEVNTDINDTVKVSTTEHQKSVQLGDILFTGSSETPDECGMSSVLTTPIDEPFYLNSFCFGFRFYDNNLLLPGFSKYLFRDEQIREQISKTANGVTRFNICKKLFAKIKIPLPPLPIQEEIVRILDTFTELEAKLEAELEARKKQYEYYRDELLTFGDEVEWKTLGEIAKKVSSGGTPKTGILEYYGGNIPWLRTQEVNFGEIRDTGVKITEAGLKNSSAKWIPENCVIVAMYGATVGKIGINKIPMTTNQACANIHLNDNIANYRYVFFYLLSQYEYIKSLGTGSQTNINSKIVKNIYIPIPPLSEQERIVAILDKFDALVNDISVGLPAEIEARRKQYEYYRNKLLTFKEFSSCGGVSAEE